MAEQEKSVPKPGVKPPDEGPVDKLLQGIDSWSFDIFQIEDDDLPKMVEKIFRNLAVFENFPIDLKKFRAFMRSMVARYQPNPYHNFRHACDVLHAVYLMLTLTEGAQRLNELEKFALALAALCHDVDHPGLTNAFLVAANDPIALRYNDKAVLESHHAATTFLTLRGHDTLNIMTSLDEPHQRHLRKLVLSCILATDMGLHAEILGHFQTRLNDPRPFEMSSSLYKSPGPDKAADSILTPELSTEESSQHFGSPGTQTPPVPVRRPAPTPNVFLPPLSSSSDVVLLLQMIIKCADLSNVIKPFFLSKRWSALLLLEWFRQGDIEKELGMHVSKFMDREDPTTLMAMTCGCIDFVAKPMYEATAVLLPHLHDEALANLALNKSLWSAFSTNGRRSSETAQVILGPFTPPLLSIDKMPEKFSEASVKLEGKLFATSSGEYSGSDKTTSQIFADRQAQWGNGRSLERLSQSPTRALILGGTTHLERQTRAHSLGDQSQLLGGNPFVNQSLPLKQTEVPMPLSFLCNQADMNKGSTRPDSGDSHGWKMGAEGNLQTSRGSRISARSSLVNKNEPNTIALHLGSDTRSPSFGPSDLQASRLQITQDIDGRTIAKSGSKGLNKLGFWDSIRVHPTGKKINSILDATIWVSINIIATFVGMFADDFMKACLPKQADIFEIHFLITCIVIFLFEFISLSILRQDYFLGFFFWLDFIGSVSLLTIITNIYEENLVIARTGRAAKSVTRLSKLMEASHLSNFFPMVIKLLRNRNSIYDEGEKDYLREGMLMRGKPSQIWTRLSELTTQKLIIGLLVLIILIPFLHENTVDLGPLTALNMLNGTQVCTLQYNNTLAQFLDFNTKHNYNLVYLGVKGGCCNPNVTCLGLDNQGFVQVIPTPTYLGPNGKTTATQQYRSIELLVVTSDNSQSEAYYSIRSQTRKKYGLNMVLTATMLAILGAWSFFLSRDSNRLIIQPIERMVEFVKELAEDPVSFAGKAMAHRQQTVAPTGKVMETRVVEAALFKIASLTKVALGDAGMDILSVNLKGKAFNPMIPGKKIRACFGFCDIRNFTDATECLQEDVMMFVNKIADVVHNKVVLHQGFPNKNIGDAFLLVWKKSVADNTNKKRGTSFADRALQSFLDIIQSIETSQTLVEFAMHPAIQRRMPGYRIHMGFGLHVGWAIEGAIGSSHKVDPSYLSPHVNMASRLEAATKQYGVMMLISETVIAHLTKSSLRDCCRKLDRITVKGSAEPFIIYTFDMPLFQRDLKGNPTDYRDMFEGAVDNYIEGEWASSLEKLEECLQLWPTDKPAQLLLNFMASHNYRVPLSWQGFRELTEK